MVAAYWKCALGKKCGLFYTLFPVSKIKWRNWHRGTVGKTTAYDVGISDGCQFGSQVFHLGSSSLQVAWEGQRTTVHGSWPCCNSWEMEASRWKTVLPLCFPLLFLFQINKLKKIQKGVGILTNHFDVLLKANTAFYLAHSTQLLRRFLTTDMLKRNSENIDKWDHDTCGEMKNPLV